MNMKRRTLISVALVILVTVLTIGVIAADQSVYQQNKDAAHEAAELMRRYGYPEDNPVIRAASDWWWENEREEKAQQEVKIEAPIQAKEEPSSIISFTEEQKETYPVACSVWRYLREDMELSEVVAAGIMGNMMQECGGNTLNLQPYLCVNNFLGLCMWYSPYTDGHLLYGADVTDQLEYLKDTLQKNMELFGGDYSYFCSLDNVADAAWYFDEYYERGNWHSVRARNAQTALEYFGEGES